MLETQGDTDRLSEPNNKSTSPDMHVPIHDNDADGPAVSSPPWTAQEFYPEAPHHSKGADVELGWGYTINKTPYDCTFEQLRSHIAWDRSKNIKLVWTPYTPHMVPPEEVPELLYDIRHRDVLYAKQQLRLYLIIAAAWTALGAFNAVGASSRTNTPFISYFILPLVLGIIPAIQTAWSLQQMRTHAFTAQDASNKSQQLRYQEWVRRNRAPFTLSFMVVLLFVFLVQAYTSIQHLFSDIFNHSDDLQRTWSAIDAAGLVKSAVWNGEVWRLFTGPLLHGSIWHIAFNLLALYVFGKVLEVLLGWVYVPVVFFFSALAGSILSLLLLPVSSVGSSGGIMGIVGFLIVLGYYNRASLPPDFLKSMFSTVAFVAVFGLVAFAIIDNAAHAGGAICGALLGYLMLPHRPIGLPRKPEHAPNIVKVLATLCTLGLVASAIASIVALFTWR